MPFSAVWSVSILFVILSSLIRVYTTCYFQQSDNGLNWLPFSAVRSGSTLVAILILIRLYTSCQSRGARWLSGRVSDSGARGRGFETYRLLCPVARHFTPRKYWLITQEAVAPSWHDWKIVNWDVKPQHKQTKVAILSLIRVYTSCHSQFDQGLHNLTFSAVS